MKNSLEMIFENKEMFSNVNFDIEELKYISEYNGVGEFIIENEDDVIGIKCNDNDECILVMDNDDEWLINKELDVVVLLIELD